MTFGRFEADLQNEELWRDGARVRLQRQPFQVLAILLERPGCIVTRDDLQQRLWGQRVTVDFDHGLNAAIKKLREALEDSAETPEFIQTVARKGYRFLAPVQVVNESERADHIAGMESPVQNIPKPKLLNERGAPYLKWRLYFGLAGLLVLLVAALFTRWQMAASDGGIPPMMQMTFSGRVSAGAPIFESLPTILSDGSRVYFTETRNRKTWLKAISVNGGEAVTLALPTEIQAPTLSAISRDGTKLILRDHLSPDTEQAVWIVPTTGGLVRRFSNILAHDATWTRDGLHVLYATGSDLFIANENGADIKKFSSVPGRAFWLRWSPDQSKLRFTLMDPKNHTSSLWEINADASNLHPLLPKWSSPSTECCGDWTPDGRHYLFESSRGGLGSICNIWMMQGDSSLWGLTRATPARITNGPLNYASPVTDRFGNKTLFIGLDNRYELLAYNSNQQQFVPFRRDLQLTGRLEFSRDGRWIEWVKAEDGSLWRSRADGTEKMELSPPPMQVFLAHWSPDSSQLAMMAREPGGPWKIYLVSATGGNVRPIVPNDDRNEGDPDWSPDGKLLVFGRVPKLMANESDPKQIYLLDLRTQQLSIIPGSDRFFSPRWSPDGRFIVAISEDHMVMLYNTKEKKWTLLVNVMAADPVWSHDSRAVYLHAFMDSDSPIYRVAVPSGHPEAIAGLGQLDSADLIDYSFVGLAPGDVPVLRARVSAANIYSRQLDKSGQ